MKKKILLVVLGVGLSLGAYAGYEYYDSVAGRKCSPKGQCTACKNCSGCKHCAHDGGSCSVCRR